MWRWLSDDKCSHFERTLACDGQMDGHNAHSDIAYTMLAWHRVVKTCAIYHLKVLLLNNWSKSVKGSTG